MFAPLISIFHPRRILQEKPSMLSNTKSCSNCVDQAAQYDIEIDQSKKRCPAMTLQEKIFKKWDEESLTSKYDWENQLDLFFEDSGHDECGYRNKILRLLMEDPLPSQWKEGVKKKEFKESDLSIHRIRSTVMREARGIYSRYCRKHPEDLHRAALVHSYWREKHFEYDYEVFLEKSAAKRSLINLFYRLNITDSWMDQRAQHAINSSPSTMKEEDTYSETSHFFGSASGSTHRGPIIAEEALYHPLKLSPIAGDLTSQSVSPSPCSTCSNDSHYCSFHASHNSGCQYDGAGTAGSCARTTTSDVDPLTTKVNGTKRKEHPSSAVIQGSESRRAQSDKYQYTIKNGNGVETIEIID